MGNWKNKSHDEIINAWSWYFIEILVTSQRFLSNFAVLLSNHTSPILEYFWHRQTKWRFMSNMEKLNCQCHLDIQLLVQVLVNCHAWMLLVESFLLLLLKEQSESDFNPREFSSFRHAKWGSMSNIKEWISRQHAEEASAATELSSYKYLKFNASWYQLILRPSWSQHYARMRFF